MNIAKSYSLHFYCKRNENKIPDTFLTVFSTEISSHGLSTLGGETSTNKTLRSFRKFWPFLRKFMNYKFIKIVFVKV